jgi:hypothetical protein
MKMPIAKLPLLAAVALALSLGSARGGILIEDDFIPATGGSSPASVAGRHPSKGPDWEGTAMVQDGLVHDQQEVFSAAFSEIEAPSDFKKLIVKIRYRPRCGLQLAFGFANSADALRNNDRRDYNAGLMWVNTVGRVVGLAAGVYADGEGVTGLPIPSNTPIPDLVEMEFEVENQGTRAYPGRIVANGKEIVSQDVTPTEAPTFRYFFIQFRGVEGQDPNQAIVEHVSVEAE